MPKVTELRVIYDDREDSERGWFARAFNTDGEVEVQLLADDWEAAVPAARLHFNWHGTIAVYDSISQANPSRRVSFEIRKK